MTLVNRILGLGLCLLLLNPKVQAQHASALHGRWESAASSYGGLGDLVEFTSTGRLIWSPGALLRGSFRADSGRLIRTFPHDSTPEIVQFAVRGDTLVQWRTGQPDSLRILRLPGSSRGAGIVGQWSYRHYTGATAFETYWPDSTWRLWIPFRADTSAYRVARDTILADGGPVAGRYRWTITGDGLQLRSLDGLERISSYVRSRP